jgi:serine/threonine protein kinase
MNPIQIQNTVYREPAYLFKPYFQGPPSYLDTRMPVPDTNANTDTDIDTETEIKLINKGTYGCVYRPEITCDGDIGDSFYVSKIQMNDPFIQKEQKIGSLIQEKIPHYLQYFSPIINTCNVSISAISEAEQSKCDIFNPENTENAEKAENADYISSKIRYVGNQDIKTYLESLPNDESIFVKKIQSSYLYILQSLKKLKEIGIIHYDIKSPNILYDENNHSPIIIDFGISFIGSSVTPENRYYVFYTKELYPFWCIDIYIISYMVQTKMNPNENISEQEKRITVQELEQLFETFYTQLNKTIPILPEEHALILKNFENTFRPFIGRTWESLYDFLYKPNIYETWDHYSLAIVYLMIMNEIKEPSNFINNGTIQQYIKLWKSIVFAMPGSRNSLEKTMEEFLKI